MISTIAFAAESIDNFACFVLGLFSSILPRKIYIAFQRWVRLISVSGLVIGLDLAGCMFQEEGWHNLQHCPNSLFFISLLHPCNIICITEILSKL